MISKFSTVYAGHVDLGDMVFGEVIRDWRGSGYTFGTVDRRID